MKNESNDAVTQGININQLLAAPFIAAANANAAMATKQTDFLLKSCFYADTEKGTGKVKYRPKMITLTMTRNNLVEETDKSVPPKMEQITSTFEVPLLTIIPFSSLCVTDVNVKFEMEIVSQLNTSKTSDKNSKGNDKNLEMKGIVSYDSSSKENSQYQRTNSSKLSVEMNAGTIPLTIGFTTLLELYTKNISASSVEQKSIPTKNQ
ncbi:DUF2589 domain-containing protein [Fluviicola taffensis]|uniref:DUF2589 domain-containing protein n=1 Tax=Fluviicola taffensis TaxID=191579 RepID=UPI003137922B